MKDIVFDEVLVFDEQLFQENIANHDFPKPDELDGKGVGDVIIS